MDKLLYVLNGRLNLVNFSVLMLHEQKTPALTFIPAAYLARHFPTSVNIQEQHDEGRPSLHLMNEEGTSQVSQLFGE